MFRKYSVWILIIFFGSLYSVFSVVRHLKFETYIFDLGYYDQLLWLASHGEKIFSSILEAHPWVDHFSPSIFLLVPLYWIWSSPVTLLIFQAFFICLGAYPIYLLSLKKTHNFIFSISLSLAYLVFYGLQNAVAYDFHAVALGPTLLAFIFLTYEEKKLRLFWTFLLIFVGLQENFFILASVLGLFLVFKYKDYKRGLGLFLGGVILYFVLVYFIIPSLFNTNYYYVPRHLFPIRILDILKMLYTPFSKVEVVFWAFAAFGFLPLLSWPFFILLGEEFFGRFIATTNPNWWILGFHYNAILAPILAFAAIETVNKYFKKRYALAAGLLFAGIVLSQLRVKPDIPKMFKKSYYDVSQTSDAKEVLKLIPDTASVAATNDLGAQIAHRKNLIFLTNCIEDPSIWGPDGKRCFNLAPDYIVADMNPKRSDNNFYPDYNRDSIYRYFDYLISQKKYELVKKLNYIYLLKKT